MHLVPQVPKNIQVTETKMSQAKKTSRIEQEIDQNLKRAYDEVANQELPSRFTDLLSQLRAQDDAARSQGSKNDA